MCILAMAQTVLEQFPVVMIHQREEEYARETAPPALDGSVYACLDKLGGAYERAVFWVPARHGGGTWMGFNTATGTVVALTNVRSRFTLPADARSRGILVRNLLSGPSCNGDAAAPGEDAAPVGEGEGEGDGEGGEQGEGGEGEGFYEGEEGGGFYAYHLVKSRSAWGKGEDGGAEFWLDSVCPSPDAIGQVAPLNPTLCILNAAR
ncbi:hypothetical protein T484DRAFT_3583466 [Baffinella frigidus]|nr:hypothetical protein T484DRAFT_3583466 [Cryptophyta sp. CCMP2293]